MNIFLPLLHSWTGKLQSSYMEIIAVTFFTIRLHLLVGCSSASKKSDYPLKEVSFHKQPNRSHPLSRSEWLEISVFVKTRMEKLIKLEKTEFPQVTNIIVFKYVINHVTLMLTFEVQPLSIEILLYIYIYYSWDFYRKKNGYIRC